MSDDMIRGGTLQIYPDQYYRYCIGDNPDIPEYVDLWYEEWDDDGRAWKQQGATFKCVPVPVLMGMVKAAQILSSWEGGEHTPETFMVTVTPKQGALVTLDEPPVEEKEP